MKKKKDTAKVDREVEEVGFLGGHQRGQVVHQRDLLVPRPDVLRRSSHSGVGIQGYLAHNKPPPPLGLP